MEPQEISQENIVLVDGFAIRNTIDTDFGIVHRHTFDVRWYAPKFYIPEDEVWVDYPFTDEIDFILKSDRFTEADDLHSYEELREKARKELTLPGKPPRFIRRREERGGISVAYVDGKIVRQYFDPEFVFAGHDLVYSSYIPSNTIWIDMKMDQREIPYILHHELVERKKMSEGTPYAIAHEFATVAEREMRREHGVGFYPGDPDYPWHGLSHDEIIKNHYIVRRPIKKHPVSVEHFEQSHSMCGPAALKIALSGLGVNVTESKLSKLSSADRSLGTEHEGMVKAVAALGLSPITKEKGTIKELENLIVRKKIPVIVGWFDRDGDHYSVVIDVTPTHIVLSDPAWDIPERYIDREFFEQVWFDFIGKENKIVSWHWYMYIESKTPV